MDCCTKRRLLTVMTSVCACAAFGLLCISVATDYWLFTREKTTEGGGNKTFKYINVYSGLWRRCYYDNGNKQAKCYYIEYFADKEREGLGTTDAIMLNIPQATMFPLASLVILLIGGILCFIGHCNENRKMLTFVSGILFVLAGLCTLVGLILYIGSITGEVGNKPRSSVEEPRFIYDYGSSFFMAVGSFVLTELSGVFSVYLYISKHKLSQRVKRLALKSDHNDRNHQGTRHFRRPPRDNSQDRAHSRDPSASRSESYFTYTPISDASHELSNYTFTRENTNNTISTTAELHAPKENSTSCITRSVSPPMAVSSIDIVRRTTPV